MVLQVPATHADLGDDSALDLAADGLQVAAESLSVALPYQVTQRAHIHAAHRLIEAATAQLDAARGTILDPVTASEAGLVNVLGLLVFLTGLGSDQLGRVNPVELHRWLTEARDQVTEGLGGVT